jgi:dsDNA-specific endonuclease/ATPase MutS2
MNKETVEARIKNLLNPIYTLAQMCVELENHPELLKSVIEQAKQAVSNKENLDELLKHVDDNARKIEKLERVIKQWEGVGEDLSKECSIARKHNYLLEATLLDEKSRLVQEFCMKTRLKVIEELIAV